MASFIRQPSCPSRSSSAPPPRRSLARSFAKWINSYRDLPLMINQWANVVRWELRPRVLLRTTEFLWQEGHTAHATEEEALEEMRRMLHVYGDFAEQVLAIPVIPGEKPESERFPGADVSLTIEAMMQDGKALQSGTSHYLGQNFSRAMGMEFTDEDGERKLAHTTSWGVTTRLLGAVVMAHADDNGLRLPPRVAPQQVQIVPITRDDPAPVLEAAEGLRRELADAVWAGAPVRADVDARDRKPAEKRWEWIRKGAPLVIELGGRDIEQGVITVTRRDDPELARDAIPETAPRRRSPGSSSRSRPAIRGGRQAPARATRARTSPTSTGSASSSPAMRPTRAASSALRGARTRRPRKSMGEFGVTVRCIPFDAELPAGASA